VNWKSFTEQYLDSCGVFQDAVLAILAVIAKQERIRRSDRASAAIAKLRRQGKTGHHGRKRKVFDREEARKLHADGVPLRKIAEKLGVGTMTVQRAVTA
jgi:DNA invertase Pin-like site-specific DNA recombinase